MNCVAALHAVAGICAVIFSGRLLCMLVPTGVFWAIIGANLSVVLLAFGAGCLSSRARHWMSQPLRCNPIMTLLLVLLDLAIIVVERFAIRRLPIDLADDFPYIFVAVFGIAMTSSSLNYLVFYHYLQERASRRRLLRKLAKLTWWAPKAKLQLCDDLSTAFPGECAICLESLDSLPSELASLPARGGRHPANAGLLRLPCEHTFHGECAERWFAQEFNCPLCRVSIGNLGRCVRFCARRPLDEEDPKGGGGAGAASPGSPGDGDAGDGGAGEVGAGEGGAGDDGGSGPASTITSRDEDTCVIAL